MLFTTLLALFGAASAAAAAIETSVFEPAPSSLAVAEKALDVQLGLIAETAAEDVSLDKRATEGLHFVNCQGNGYTYSLIIYCADDSNCNHQPATVDSCYMSSSGWWWWEGRTEQPCTFPGGVTLYYTLPADAWSKPVYSPVGSAHNPYHNYIVYHDDSHTMYTASNGAVCKSIYYLLQK